MTGTLRAFRDLAGDALVAIGEVVRGGSANVDVDFDDTIKRHTQAAGWQAPIRTGGAMESDGPLLSWPAPAIPRAEVRSALDDLSDSKLLNVAATVIAGWKPILLSTEAAALTDVDLLVEALRDRAAQFQAVEHDAGEAWQSPDHLHAQLHAHLTTSAQTRSE